MNNRVIKYAVLLTFVALAACTSKITPSADANSSKPYFAEASKHENNGIARKVSRVELKLSDEAQKKFARNYRFDRRELHRTVLTVLNANQLIDDKSVADLPVIKITITNIRIRSHFNAVMFGFMSGADSITGDVAVVRTNGEELQRFNVDVSYALGGTEGGEDSFRMGWMYEAFAERTADALLGRKKSEDS